MERFLGESYSNPIYHDRYCGWGFFFSLIFSPTNWRGEKEMISHIEEGGLGLFATAFVFLLVWALHFLWITPRALWKEEHQANKSWKEIFEPKLILECSPEIPGCIASPSGGYDFNSTFRLIVRSLGFNPILNCQGRLLEIQRDGKQIWGGEKCRSLLFYQVGLIQRINNLIQTAFLPRSSWSQGRYLKICS